jgi:hypothetical protein
MLNWIAKETTEMALLTAVQASCDLFAVLMRDVVRSWREEVSLTVSSRVTLCPGMLQKEWGSFGTLAPLNVDRLCGLVVGVPGCRPRGSGFDSRCCQIFGVAVGLERGPFSPCEDK